MTARVEARHRFLVIVNDPVAPSGSIGEAIIANGDAYDIIMPNEEYASFAPLAYPGIPADPGDYAGLIILGGPMSANEDAVYPYLKPLMELVRRFHDNERPVLGVCLGAQIIARVIGGGVSPMGKLESGFVELTCTDADADDPVFLALDTSFTVFENHFEAISLPAGAVNLVTGGACEVQAFRYGAKTYGLQFHMEVTVDIVREWMRHFGATLYAAEPKLLSTLEADFARYQEGQKAIAHTIISAWCELVK